MSEHTVEQLEKMLADAKVEASHQAFPKWVIPHASHVVRKSEAGAPEHVSTPAFPHNHVNRIGGEVTVLVNDAAEEAKALALMEEPKDEPAAPIDASSDGKGSANFPT